MSARDTNLEYSTSAQRRFERLCEQMCARLTAAGLSSDDLLATLPQARARVYARRYGKPLPSRRDSHTKRDPSPR
jgi:hypothetical protein